MTGHGHGGQTSGSIGSKRKNEVGDVGRRQLCKALWALIKSWGVHFRCIGKALCAL